ncbi:MAG: TetR family transcriptional regulator [Bacteroidetes bacterium]|nr:TetR family transcriptional regulator [Bacteroidota bacterium]
MQKVVEHVGVYVNPGIYIKDPESSELGRRIISGSIELMEEIGFDAFTFRKLAASAGTTEASVYRYFENKHKLLLYLVAWYWAWLEYRLVFVTANVEPAKERLKRSVELLVQETEQDGQFAHINEIKLHHIVVAESVKVYLTPDVDHENRIGAFQRYKRLVERISDIVREVNPRYKYPHMLISTIVEGSHHQRFFARHLPGLTDKIKGEDSVTLFSVESVLKCVCQ